MHSSNSLICRLNFFTNIEVCEPVAGTNSHRIMLKLQDRVYLLFSFLLFRYTLLYVLNLKICKLEILNCNVNLKYDF